MLADEIYEKILFDDAVHHHAATFAGDDVLCLTFSGLSKAYRVCGYRAGWVMVTGPKELATDFLEGLTLLANMRMCANVPGAARDPDRARRVPVDQRADRARRPVLRAEQARLEAAQRDPRVSAASSRTGALYCFPRLDPEVYPIEDDEAVRARPAARQEDPGHPRHRLQLVRARPLPPGHAARRRTCSPRRSGGSPTSWRPAADPAPRNPNGPLTTCGEGAMAPDPPLIPPLETRTDRSRPAARVPWHPKRRPRTVAGHHRSSPARSLGRGGQEGQHLVVQDPVRGDSARSPWSRRTVERGELAARLGHDRHERRHVV